MITALAITKWTRHRGEFGGNTRWPAEVMLGSYALYHCWLIKVGYYPCCWYLFHVPCQGNVVIAGCNIAFIAANLMLGLPFQRWPRINHRPCKWRFSSTCIDFIVEFMFRSTGCQSGRNIMLNAIDHFYGLFWYYVERQWCCWGWAIIWPILIFMVGAGIVCIKRYKQTQLTNVRYCVILILFAGKIWLHNSNRNSWNVTTRSSAVKQRSHVPYLIVGKKSEAVLVSKGAGCHAEYAVSILAWWIRLSVLTSHSMIAWFKDFEMGVVNGDPTVSWSPNKHKKIGNLTKSLLKKPINCLICWNQSISNAPQLWKAGRLWNVLVAINIQHLETYQVDQTQNMAKILRLDTLWIKKPQEWWSSLLGSSGRWVRGCPCKYMLEVSPSVMANELMATFWLARAG